MADTQRSDQSDQDAELDALLAQLEAERPAFEAWLAEQVANAQRDLDELLATLEAQTPSLADMLAQLEGADDAGASGAACER